MKIYLIGYMGCGKSTLGRKLANQLDIPFIDMDHFIEERYYKTIPQIFEEEGEVEFRLKEQKALKELSEFTNIVIATGGGAPCFFDNMEVMNSTGKTVFLNIDPKVLAYRLMHSKTERPLIKGKSKDELIKFIDETLAKRSLFYKQAKYEITEPDLSAVEILEIISK